MKKNNYEKIKLNIKYLIKCQKFDEAFEILSLYNYSNQDDAEGFVLRGMLLLMQNKVNEAKKSFEKSLYIDENNIDTLLNIAQIIQNEGKQEEALLYYKKAYAYVKDSEIKKAIYTIIAQIENNNESNKCKESNLEKAQYLEKFKQNIEELINNGMISEAKTFIQEYEDIEKDSADLFAIKSVIAIIEQDYLQAHTYIEKGLEHKPWDYDLLYNKAFVFDLENKNISAFRSYKRLLKYSTDVNRGEIEKKLEELENLPEIKEYNSRKKVLFIAHIFPPVSGSGVQRSLKFVKYLRQTGWEPIVLTVGSTRYPLKDESMISEIPEEVEIIRIDERMTINSDYANKLIQLYSNLIKDEDLIKEYVNTLRISQEHMNNYLLLPDPYILWATEVIDSIENKVDLTEIDMIYTTSGPYSSHIIGHTIKKMTELPWVADFRDEWTNNPYVKQDKKSLIYRMNYLFESEIVNFANDIITVTPSSKKNYEKLFNLNNEKVHEITNGYDEADFLKISTSKTKNSKFTIMHNGLLYLIRTPQSFFDAIIQLIEETKIDKNLIEIIIPWIENEDKWKKYLQEKNVLDIVNFTGYLTHEKSLEMASKSDLLLLIVGPGDENKDMYPGKIFEYLRLCKPILSLSPAESITEQLIVKLNRGHNIDFNDIEAIKEYIYSMYIKWEQGNIDTYKTSNEIEKYDRKNLARALGNLFDCVYEANINSKYNERRYEPAIKCDEVKLTVVMTTYNRAEYIASAVQSILNQTYQQFHFIILDNCSTDHTEQVIKSINDSRIRYIKNEKNIGFVSNTNKAIELCETEYLSIVHDDDIFKSHFLETEMKIMEQNPLLSIVGSNRTYIDENGLKLNDMHVLNRDYIFKKFEYIKSGLTLCMPTIIYRMSFLLENNLKYSEELGFVSDSFFQYELNMMDTQIYFVAEPLIFYRTHKNQFSKQVLQVAKNRVTFSDKIYKKAKRDNIMWLMDYMIRYLENVLLGKLHNFDFDEEFVFELLKFADSKNIMKHLNYDTICFINLFKKYNKNKLVLNLLENNNIQKLDKEKPVLDKWIKKIYRKTYLSNVLVQKGIKEVVLYGEGIYAYLFIKDCYENGISVKFIINDDARVVHTNHFHIPIYGENQKQSYPKNVGVLVMLYNKQEVGNKFEDMILDFEEVIVLEDLLETDKL